MVEKQDYIVFIHKQLKHIKNIGLSVRMIVVKRKISVQKKEREKAMEQADLYGHSLQREVAFLTVHSMYHLLGYDHEDDEEAKKMEELEVRILKSIGVANPYSE